MSLTGEAGRARNEGAWRTYVRRLRYQPQLMLSASAILRPQQCEAVLDTRIHSVQRARRDGECTNRLIG